MSPPISTPIIKPVDGTCNLSCSYCYSSRLKASASPGARMSLATLARLVDFFCSDQSAVEFIWHGGEPLLAGLGFYREAVACQQRWIDQGKSITNFVQTNGVLINEEWAGFLAENGFVVGVSLDGPACIHDAVRKRQDGGGSHEAVMRGIRLLQDVGVFNGVICGVSNQNVDRVKEVFEFFISRSIKKLKFNRVRHTGDCDARAFDAVTPAAFAQFMIDVFDTWLALDDPEVEIRDIQTVVGLVLGGRMRECIYLGQCQQFATVYADGSVYACDSFERGDALRFGTIHDAPAEVRASPQLTFLTGIMQRRRRQCAPCRWYWICRGGCMRDGYSGLDAVEPNDEVCQSLQRYFEHIVSRLESYGLHYKSTC